MSLQLEEALEVRIEVGLSIEDLILLVNTEFKYESTTALETTLVKDDNGDEFLPTNFGNLKILRKSMIKDTILIDLITEIECNYETNELSYRV